MFDMNDGKASKKNPKRWHQKWWGILFLLICVLVFIYGAALIYQIVYYVDAQNSAKQISLPVQSSGINIRDFVEKKDAPFLGNKQGEIVIVEFSDFQCPVSKAEAPIIKMLVTQDSFIKLIFRNFPNPVSHPNALAAALAAQCANEQNKFWEYHDQLFANQNDLSDSNLKNIAANLGLNTNQFNQCLGSSKYFSLIQSDMQDGLLLNITATPTFFINGTKVMGDIPYDTFKKIIDGIKQFNKQNSQNQLLNTK
jgi:protein-disulfide isomerase